MLYQLFDSFYLLLITLAISVPISLGGAVFLVEYAPDGPIRDIASTAIETLSSLPSIVVGMFGFLVFSVQLGWKYSIISGAVALTMFNIPILVRVIQQALEDVPRAQRDACLAMGLTRWEATLHILVPEAMPAIVTGIVLSAGLDESLERRGTVVGHLAGDGLGSSGATLVGGIGCAGAAATNETETDDAGKTTSEAEELTTRISLIELDLPFIHATRGHPTRFAVWKDTAPIRRQPRYLRFLTGI